MQAVDEMLIECGALQSLEQDLDLLQGSACLAQLISRSQLLQDALYLTSAKGDRPGLASVDQQEASDPPGIGSVRLLAPERLISCSRPQNNDANSGALAHGQGHSQSLCFVP